MVRTAAPWRVAGSSAPGKTTDRRLSASWHRASCPARRQTTVARLDLLLAAFQARLSEFTDGAEAALRIEDPWASFVGYLENLFRVQAGDRGYNDSLSRRFPGNAETERIHDRMCQQIDEVLGRAQAAGRVRADLALADIVTLIWTHGRMIDATNATAPNAWQRQLHLMLDAYRAENAHPVSEPPLTDEQLYAAVVHLSQPDR